MIQSNDDKTIKSGWWLTGNAVPQPGDQAVRDAATRVKQPLYVLNINDQIAVAQDGAALIGDQASPKVKCYPMAAYVPPLLPENLGDPYFKKTHNLRYAYIAGAMANGITSVKMVQEMGRAGMIGFFGAAGLSIVEIEAAINEIQQSMNGLPYGFNLTHSPNDPELETKVVQLYLQRGIRLISASAFMDINLALVFFRVKGIHIGNSGNIVCPNKIIAKVSRVEVAEKFFSPPPAKLLARLVEKSMLTKEEAFLASRIPVADNLTAEADSGGHTDNRPAISLLPTMLALRNKMAAKYKYEIPLGVGLGGGIATPEATAAAFAMGAAYVLTGSVNQSCLEAGTSETVRLMLAETMQADVTMAPAADMFEMGVKVQVLKRGTMFPLRAIKLYDLYRRFDSFESIPEKQKNKLEKDFLRCSFQKEWNRTKSFFAERDPRQVKRAELDPKHKMALVFRSYLGQSSGWAISGDPERKIDYQIWCGQAMGAFNEWVKGSFLENPENRKVVPIAMNLLFGAAVITRINWLRSQGIRLPQGLCYFAPMELSAILDYI